MTGSGTESKRIVGTACWAPALALNISNDAITQRCFMTPPEWQVKNGRVAARLDRIIAAKSGMIQGSHAQDREICARRGVALAAAALQFPLAHPAVASVITRMRSTGEAQANLAHCRAEIPEAFWDELEHERLIAPGAPVPAG